MQLINAPIPQGDGSAGSVSTAHPIKNVSFMTTATPSYVPDNTASNPMMMNYGFDNSDGSGGLQYIHSNAAPAQQNYHQPQYIFQPFVGAAGITTTAAMGNNNMCIMNGYAPQGSQISAHSGDNGGMGGILLPTMCPSTSAGLIYSNIQQQNNGSSCIGDGMANNSVATAVNAVAPASNNSYQIRKKHTTISPQQATAAIATAAMPSTRNQPVAEFLYQLTRMLTDSVNLNIISWNRGRIDVHHPHRLESDILQRYFRHSKFASFQRQLNYFGFRKLAGKGKMSPCSYVNSQTTEDICSLLLIRRKTNGAALQRNNAAAVASGKTAATKDKNQNNNVATTPVPDLKLSIECAVASSAQFVALKQDQIEGEKSNDADGINKDLSPSILKLHKIKEESNDNADVADLSSTLLPSSSQHRGSRMVAATVAPSTVVQPSSMFYHTNPLATNAEECFHFPSSRNNNDTTNFSCTTQSSSSSSTTTSSPIISSTNGPATMAVSSNTCLLNTDLSDSGNVVTSDDSTSTRSATTSSNSNNDEKSNEFVSFDLACQFVSPASSSLAAKITTSTNSIGKVIIEHQQKHDVQLIIDDDEHFNWSPSFTFPSNDNLLFLAGNGAECIDNNVDGTRAKYDNSLMDLAMLPGLPMPTKSELRQ